MTGNLEEKSGTVELLPDLDRKKIVLSTHDMAYFEDNTLSLIKAKTKIRFPYYGKIKTNIKFKDKDSLKSL
ncbi:hypothetical protein [Marinitoga lauensis]|uniref:hypothetical protein n=1 Tax=Marinitoga lauensis TaxID=2201189 RepID=UPI001012E356|nr:hypothetical protein [Marinitoga lauensis]